MYAIVDIEMTGGTAFNNGIIELAIVLHDGKAVESKFSWLINPLMPIQPFVQSLTGITDEMVASAPLFNQLAPEIYNLLENRIFVAHNVSFDYVFVHHYLAKAGYQLKTPRVCTIKLAKKVLPDLPKYGLATLCKELNIANDNRHRAEGDALATAELFTLLLTQDTRGELQKIIKQSKARLAKSKKAA